jgi:hypothetical protein
LLSVEEIRKHLLNLGDTSGATDKNDFVNLRFAHVGILEDLLNWRHALSEEVNAKLLKFGARNASGVIFTISESFALNFSLMG